MNKRKLWLNTLRFWMAAVMLILAVIAAVYAVAARPRLSIALNGDSTLSIEYGGEYVEQGATAFYGKKQYTPVEIKGEVNTEKVGTYIITYTVKRDKAEKSVSRTVTVYDNTPPLITVKNTAQVFWGDPVSSIKLDYTATDNADGDCTKSVVRTDNANSITLSVTDSSGNKSEVTVPVKFLVHPGKKVIYLTFDDGPSPNTSYILDILSTYNVKATFFITAQHPESFSLINRIYSEGHTVAAHTYSHKWEIYKSAEDYFADLDAINNVIKKHTGKASKIIRFPGGSSNRVSKKHKEGIMTELVLETALKGYTYFDWNIDSMDTSTSDPDKIFKNITSRLGNGYYNILMHDTKPVHRKALPKVIEYCLENGYTFLPIDETTPPVHHTVRN